MRLILYSSLLIILQLSFAGCRKANVLNMDQKILFQYSYVNNSITTDNQGFIIDNEGNILVFSQPAIWNYPDRNGLLTRAQVEENIRMSSSTGKKVPEAELHKFVNYINYFASSKVSAKKNIATNKGTYNYFCFSYLPGNSMYRQVTIRTLGNYECENLNFFSKRAVDWMNLILQGLPVHHQ